MGIVSRSELGKELHFNGGRLNRLFCNLMGGRNRVGFRFRGLIQFLLKKVRR